MFHSKDPGGERIFREAFERLKAGKPEILPPGAPLTQSNVAREARRNPCALAKHRYPHLISEIQHWIKRLANDDQLSKAQATLNARRRDLELIKIQRDLALSMLVDSDARMLQLTRELEHLRAMSGANGAPAMQAMGA